MDRENYILTIINDYCLGGDSFITTDKLFSLCQKAISGLTYEAFCAELIIESNDKLIYIDSNHIYSYLTWRYECSAAENLEKLILDNSFASSCNTNSFENLSPDQREALSMALKHRLSLILGGAGSGKTTLISAIVDAASVGNNYVLCAPTGKAARNLTERTGLIARTVHSALGKAPNEDFLDAVRWEYTQLVIVDEASMMSLEMLSGILNRISKDCRVVLIGDPNQLLSVGAGDVINDLISLGFPCYTLTKNHRLSSNDNALAHNVLNFSALQSVLDLKEDVSFVIIEKDNNTSYSSAAIDAAQRYLNGESVQVLSPYKKAVQDLNKMIQDRVNIFYDGQRTFENRKTLFRDGDRVLITENDRDRKVVNGDIGILRILSDTDEHFEFCVEMSDGRKAIWNFPESYSGKDKISLAYAMTVHRSQGSEYDTIILPLTMDRQMMLYRNLFYTAISRAKCRVIIYGTKQAADICIKHIQSKRKSKLVERVNTLLRSIA